MDATDGCAERGRPLSPADHHHERLRTSRDDRDELACETIAEALALFAPLGTASTGWTLAGCASLATFFVGTCVACFPTVWRQWLAEQHDHLLGDHLELADFLDHAARRVLDPRVDADPADTAAGRDLVRTTLAAMDEPLREIAEQLGLHDASLVEIADQTGITPGTVEQRLRRHRNELTRRHENETDREAHRLRAQGLHLHRAAFRRRLVHDRVQRAAQLIDALDTPTGPVPPAPRTASSSVPRTSTGCTTPVARQHLRTTAAPNDDGNDDTAAIAGA